MQENAIRKIQTEMDQSKNDPYIQVVGAFLLQHLSTNPDDAEKMLYSEKTIAKSLAEMQKVAEKKKIGNCAVLTSAQGFEIVLKYFGIERVVVTAESSPTIPLAPKKPETSFDIKLEDLL